MDKAGVTYAKLVISAVAVAVLCAVIFSLSAQPSVDSASVSMGLAYRLLEQFAPGFDAMTPDEQAALVELWDHPVRKLAHFSEFALLGMLMLNLIRQAVAVCRLPGNGGNGSEATGSADGGSAARGERGGEKGDEGDEGDERGADGGGDEGDERGADGRRPCGDAKPADVPPEDVPDSASADSAPAPTPTPAPAPSAAPAPAPSAAPAPDSPAMAAAAWALTTLYAASDEIHQIFVFGRACRFTDICIDSAGALTGVLVLVAVRCLRRKAFERKQRHPR